MLYTNSMLVPRFSYQKLSRKTTAGKRHYSCPDGRAVPSVTTVLAITKPEKDKQGLQQWRNRVGHTAAEEITRSAANRGTKIHTFLENYLNTGEITVPGTNPFSIQSHSMASHIIDQGLKNITEFYGTEVSLYYPELYAGTTDGVGLYKGEIVIFDFKQSNKPKLDSWVDDYKIQISSYILAHDELYKTKIGIGIIMMCSPGPKYQEWIIEGQELEKYKNIWWNRLYQYYDSVL